MESLEVPEYDHESTRGAPLIEVFSVTIHREDNCNDEMMESCEIYGDIQITDGEGAIFDLYSREPDNPETVYMNESLSLTFSKDRAISPSGVVMVNVNLMDKAKNMVIANGRCVWDYRVKHDYEEILTENFKGEHSFCAALKYITYRCAVMASLEVCLSKEKGDGNMFPDDDAEVYGNISASYINKHRCLKSDVREKGPSIVLFDSSVNEAVRVKFETCFQLSRYAVVVPSYSYLVMEAHLKDRKTNREIFPRPKVINVFSSGCYTMYLGLLKVRICCYDAHIQPPPPRILKPCRKASSTGEKEESETKEKNKKPRVLSQQVIPTAMCSNGPLHLARMRWETSVMEIFSVFVGDQVSKLYGNIVVTDNYSFPRRGVMKIYQRDNDSPEELSQDSKIATIGIEGPHRSISGDNLTVDLKLQDDQGRQICDGVVQWNDNWHRQLFGKRICAIVSGAYGYAAMHYTVFPAAFSTVVNASFFAVGSSNFDANIYGIIVSEYDNDKCSTHYEKEYYRSRLFARSEADPLKSITSGSDISLLKNRVAVPNNSSLSIDADLYVKIPGKGVVERVQRVEKFEIDVDQVVSKIFQGQHFYIKVSVTWGKVLDNANPVSL